MIRASNETHDTEVIGVGMCMIVLIFLDSEFHVGFYTQESELEPSTALTYDVGYSNSPGCFRLSN